jgi:hypothetical protein
MAERLNKLNDLRNAMAHSLSSEKRRAWRPRKRVLYNGKDIYTVDGFSKFHVEMMELHEYLYRLAFNAELFPAEDI